VRAALYDRFNGPIEITDVDEPDCPEDGAIVAVRANGVCRSDWHGWVGHDPDIRLPHVPGHECTGEIAAVGRAVKRWRVGERVALPFSGGCGRCGQCRAGATHVCDAQVQPGFTHWGAFAERVVAHHADVNLVRLPDSVDFVEGAALGCRFMTAFRGVSAVGAVRPGEWIAVHGLGGVGLSAVMIAVAAGARVIGVDVAEAALERAMDLGAEHALNAAAVDDVPGVIADITHGGAQVSVDALGHAQTLWNSVACLAKRGAHVQIGLMADGAIGAQVPMALVVGRELRLLGSHGMPAVDYPQMLGLIESGALNPAKLVTKTVDLAEGTAVLAAMGEGSPDGIVVIDRF
jgi:alcohol dehydrogenase